MTGACDVAIVGSGFGGSLLAMIARRLDFRVLLLERGTHPRFAIGESASPLAGVVLEQLADRYDLPRIRPLATYGPWQRTYPELTCGLKRGFTYFKQVPGRPYRRDARRSQELAVAASPADDVSDTHWLRADVDHFFVREAAALGVEYLDQVELTAFERDGTGHWRLTGRRAGHLLRVRARLVVDASGPRGFISRSLGIDNRGFDAYPATQALFSHFTGVARCEEMPEYAPAGAPPPYPLDDAALHHVFDEGWMWVLRFGNGVTSAGVAVTDRLAADLGLSDGAAAWRRLLDRYPSLASQFAAAEPVREFTWMPRLAWRVRVAAGPGWAMLPSAAAFVDPFFSTGIPMTLVGIERLARALEAGPDSPDLERAAGTALLEADHVARFIAGCYAAFPRFDVFAAYAMCYFAIASFSEMVRRVAPERELPGFLGAADASFVRAVAELSPAAHDPGTSDAFMRRVACAVERFNAAGLCDPSKHNWYGIDIEDAVRGARKLGVPPGRVRDVLGALAAS